MAEGNFRVWSEVNPDALEILKPNLGSRKWDDLKSEDKESIWLHLEPHFFNKEMRTPYAGGFLFVDHAGRYYEFSEPNSETRRKRVDYAIENMNYLYKSQKYTKRYLEQRTHTSACSDFYSIFRYKPGDV